MLKMVDGTAIIGVDMICPLGVSTPQPPNYDRVELEGTGMLVLPNSLDAPLERLELGGKTEQVQTSGKNLFDESKNEKGYYTGGLGTVSSLKKFNGWSWNSPLNVIQNTTLSVSVAAKIKSRFQVILADDLNTVLYVNSKYSANSAEYTHSFNVVEGTTKILISVYEETSPEGVTIMLNEGVVSIPYEPYTGGKPSPSQEYPQEIKNSGKWNEETQKYEVDVKVVGKNLFDVNYFTKNENYQNKDGDANWKFAKLKVKPNTVYTVSKSKNTGVNGGINKSLTYVGALSFNNDINTAKITSDDTGVLYVMFFYRGQDVNILKEIDIQVEYGNVATPTNYEPYKEQTLTLTSDRPITKWDRLVEQGGEIGWLYGGKIIDSYNSEQIDAEYMSSTGSLTVGATVLYKLKTTEFVPIPQSEQNAIRALKTYYPTTVITADGGELDPDIKVTYRKEI